MKKVRGKSHGRTKSNAFFCDIKTRRISLLETAHGSKVGVANKINNDGCSVGNIILPSDGGENHFLTGTIWNEHGLEQITPPPGFNQSEAIDVNDKGQVLCEASDPHLEDMFDMEALKRWDLTVLPNADFSSLLRRTSFIYENGVRKPLCSDPDNPFHWNYPHAINNHGQVVGTSGCSKEFSNKSHAFIFTEGDIYDLNDTLDEGSLWTLSDAKDINDHGQIIGIGTHHGVRRGFLLNPK